MLTKARIRGFPGAGLSGSRRGGKEITTSAEWKIGTGISAGKTGGGKGKMQPVCSGGKYPALDGNTPATLSGTDVPVSSGFYGSSDNRSAFEK